MLTNSQLAYLTDNGFSVSELKTPTIYWVFSETHCIAVKSGVYDLFEQSPGSMRLLATIACKLDLEGFIILMDALGLVKSETFV